MKKVGVAVTSAVLLASGLVRAEGLRDLSAALAQKHLDAGAQVTTLPTRFVYDGESFSVTIPAPAAVKRCTSVALIGARGLSFHVTLGDSDDAGKVSSAAGALEIVACDGPAVDRLRVVSDAGRGALEFVVSFSNAPLPSLRDVLPERSQGAASSSGEAGPLPALAPAVKRAEASELRARRDGAQTVTRSSLNAGRDGSGTARIDVDAGCHRFELAASEAKKHGRVDLDAEISNAKDDSLLARDRGDAADARLDLCVGVPTALRLTFVGAAPDEPILVAHASWTLPTSFGREWSSETRARMTSAFVSHRVPSPAAGPVLVALGGAGQTSTFAQIEPGACYVASVALSHGVVRSMRIRARVGENESSEERPPQDGASLVAFCARDRDTAEIDVDARGTSVSWTLALFRVVAAAWDVE